MVEYSRNQRWVLGSCADFDAAFAAFRAALTAKPIRFTCYVAVRVQGVEGQFPNDDDLCIVPKVPPAAGFPTQGPYIQTFVDAIDPRVAADNALARVSAVLGAVAIFVTQDVLVRSRIVLVQGPNGNSMVFDTSSPLVRERRLPRSGQVVRIARSTLAATKRLRLQDAAFEAMRHLKRASEAGDAESRFMLLWLGIERLVMGGDHRTILDAVRTIVPPAITIGKIRRDVESLARAVARISYTGEEKMKLQRIAGGTPPRNPVIDQQKLLHFLLTANDDKSFQLTSLFYAHDVRLTQWYFRLRKRLAHGDADAIASYLDESRLRVERQILRLYRARNSVAHAARGPEWLGELIRHASYYLTNLIAIVLSYREHDAIRPAIEILVARVGQYDAYIELLKHGSPRACTPRALLRPTSIVGTRKN